MRTTLTLDDDVGERLQEMATRTGRAFKDVVNETLRRGLDAKPVRGKPFQLRARPMGLRAGVQLDNVAELLEQLEGPAYK